MRYKIASSDFLSYLKGALYHYTTPGVRASHARPREAPGLSAGGLQVARRQVTLKPPLPGSRQNAKGPRLLTGASIIAAARAVTRRPSGRPARCAP